MRTIVLTACLLTASNVFMTFAWYAHLRDLSGKPWLVAALVSWSIALFEVPANRIGFTVLSLPQLKIMQEVITLTVFVPFAVLYAPAAQAGSSLVGALPGGRGVLCVSVVMGRCA